ncbi:MAG: M14 metallopeptidase family protein [Pseudomonadota bacterium]
MNQLLRLSHNLKILLAIGALSFSQIINATEFTTHLAGTPNVTVNKAPDFLNLHVTSDYDFLPKSDYDPSIPTPEDVFGYPMGTWHIRHDQVVQYLQTLAEKSDRLSLEVIGHSHQQRPLMVLSITGEDNRKRLEQIRQNRVNAMQEGTTFNNENEPLIIYMGYGVHGNEPSTTNAALLIAYYLAAANDERVNAMLKDTVILLDASMNPDGYARFVHWVNSHKGYNLVSDPMHREHREGWPNGRTNHYIFDLNRDWLLLTHPESRARVNLFQSWRPHIHTDFHEMGTNTTYFFQPGVPSRKNPLTPDINVTLTNALADAHATALDQEKQMYFTEELFDDFYYGKGSSYPDGQGTIGILFEQASSRGHLQKSEFGTLSFPRTIKNQVTTSLSSFDGALKNKSAVLAYQNQFIDDTNKLISKDDNYGYLVQLSNDTTRSTRMQEILLAHKIRFHALTQETELDNVKYNTSQTIFVPLNQPQYRLIRSLFSERKRFIDNTFYDVSNWNIGFAFNLNYATVEKSDRRKLRYSDKPQAQPLAQEVKNNLDVNAVAFAFEWHDHDAPKLTQYLLRAGVNLRVAGKAFTASTKSGAKKFAPGAVIIPAAMNDLRSVARLLTEHKQSAFNQAVFSITRGMTEVGIDLGSPSTKPLKLPKVLIVGGRGTTQTEVGEIWHYLDVRVGLPATMIDTFDLIDIDLSNYTHVIFASGDYTYVNNVAIKNIDNWLKDGGVLIGQRSALLWFEMNNWIAQDSLSEAAMDKPFETDNLKYADKHALASKKRIAGAVFEVEIDLTHPLFFGFDESKLPVFKTNNLILQRSDNPFDDIAVYTSSPLLGGYTSDEMQTLVADTTAVGVTTLERGMVISFVDNVHHRGYWDGTNKLTANALFLHELFREEF